MKVFLLVGLLNFSFQAFAQTAGDQPIPVTFYSKLPAQWLKQPEPEEELLAYQLIHRLLSNQQQLEAQFVKVPHSRAERLTLSDPSGCMAAVLKTPEREKHWYFSQPFTAVFDIHLYTLAKTAPESLSQLISETEPVAFTELRTQSFDEPLLLGIDRDRNYGQALMPLLEAPGKSLIFVELNSGADIGQLWNMLLSGRLDMILEYPFMVPKAIKQRVRSIPLAETSQQLQTAYFACHKSAQGLERIKRLNLLIARYALSNSYIAKHLEEVPQAQQAMFLRLYKQLFSFADSPEK